MLATITAQVSSSYCSHELHHRLLDVLDAERDLVGSLVGRLPQTRVVVGPRGAAEHLVAFVAALRPCDGAAAGPRPAAVVLADTHRRLTSVLVHDSSCVTALVVAPLSPDQFHYLWNESEPFPGSAGVSGHGA